MKKSHPDWPEAQLLAEATKEWEAAAMKLLVETIQFVKKIRPKLKVALYCYPLREYWNGYNSSAAGGAAEGQRPHDGPVLRN